MRAFKRSELQLSFYLSCLLTQPCLQLSGTVEFTLRQSVSIRAEKTADESTTEQKWNKAQDENVEHGPMESFSSARTSAKWLPRTSGSLQMKEGNTDTEPEVPAKQHHHSAFSCESVSSEEEKSRKELEEAKGKEKRSSTRRHFSDEDLAVLEETFDKIKHPYEFLITKLANDLNTSEQKVQRWFSARRLRWRQERDLEPQRLLTPQAASSARKHPPSKSSGRKK